MKFEMQSMVLGMVGTNCYLLINTQTRETVIFDPGDEGERIARYMEREGLKPAAILLTHGHFDHIMGVPALVSKYGLPVYVHKEEAALMADPAQNACAMIGASVSLKADRLIKDNDVLTLAGAAIRVLYTPGHTKGGVSYYIEDIHAVVCGDTLFEGSVGRTDLPTGSMGTLIRSIREKLFVLDDDVTVLPGHGGQTTIGWEKQHNPFVN